MVDLGAPTGQDAFERVRLVVVKLYLMKKNIFEGTQLALYCYTTVQMHSSQQTKVQQTTCTRVQNTSQHLLFDDETY